MLLKNQSNKRNLLKYLLLIPVIGMLFWGIACENKESNSLSDNDENWGEDVVKSLMNNQKGKEIVAYMSGERKGQTYFTNVKSKKAYTNPEKMPAFKGPGEFHEYLNKEIQYPEEAKVNNISGIVYAYFEIDRKGKVQNARIIDGIEEAFDKEVLEAVKNMPDWEPAYFMGDPLVMQLVVPVSFAQISNESDAKKFTQRVGIPTDLDNDKAPNSDEKQKVFVVVEQQPRYPGGEKARKQYLAENIKYPEKAQEKGIEGTVYVSFIVEKDGSITNVRVLKGIGGGCNKEAISVVKDMPKWEPGKQRGEPVRVKFQMPLRFSLPDDSEEQ
ncbi:MAG: energy transducer TonB [Candidatus Marinimicrobia bacterium]|nr:energy transducer TonB [Candidatus Neomarinimicrobiota bacterium]